MAIAARRGGEQQRHDAGIHDRTASGDRLDGRFEIDARAHSVLDRYPRPEAPPASRASTSRGSANWLSTITPTSATASEARSRPADPRRLRTVACALRLHDGGGHRRDGVSNAAPSSHAATTSRPGRRPSTSPSASRMRNESSAIAMRIGSSFQMRRRWIPPADAIESRDGVELAANRRATMFA